MKKLVLIGAIILTTLGARAQQDTQVSQYIFNGIYINPAYTGYKEDIFIHSYYRSQWVGINGAPQSFSLAADGALTNKNVGLGLILNSDRVGAQSNFSGYVNYAYRIRLGEDETSQLSFGIAGGITQLGIDGNKLNAIQSNDQAIPVASQNTVLPDANFGIYYANSRYFLGLSGTNLLARFIKNDNSDNLLAPIPQPHIYLTGGALFSLGDATDMKFKPIFLLKDDIKGPTTIDLDGFFLLNERMSVGAFYRSSIKLYNKSNLQNNLTKQNAFGGLVEFFATPSIRIGYSYDHSLSGLGLYNYGSHELSIGFYLNSAGNGNGFGARCYKF